MARCTRNLFLLAAGLASMLAVGAGGEARVARQTAPKSTAPHPSAPPAQQQTPPAPQQSRSPDSNADAQRRQEEIRRRIEEQQIRDAERQRQQFLEDVFGDTRQRPAVRGAIQPVVAVLMQHDAEFNLESIPFTEWLGQTDVEEIPWDIEVGHAELRMDQRMEVPYAAGIAEKDLKKLAATDLYFIAAVTDPGGARLTAPKVVHHVLKTRIPSGAELRFSDYFCAQPGEYVLSMILYDPATGRHNAMTRRVRVSPIDDDPLPAVAKQLPQVEFSELSDPESHSVLEFFDGLWLPVANRRAVDLELLPVLNAPEQWVSRPGVVRRHNEQTAALVNTLSQLKLTQGSISVAGVDLAHRTAPFEQLNLTRLNWKLLAEAVSGIERQTVSLAALQNGGGAAYFREFLEKRIAGADGSPRVFIVISSAYSFARGVDRRPVQRPSGCNCRVYHLRLRHAPADPDDISKMLKPLSPKTFNVDSADDFRRALAAIIKDLEKL